MKKYLDKDWLFEQYNTMNKSSISIARECNVDKSTILKHLRKNRIKIKSNSDYLLLSPKKYMNKEWLKNEYRNKTTTSIAKECGVSPSIILKWLKKNNIAVRTRNERMSGKFHPKFKGDSYLSSGYNNIYCPDHPRLKSLRNSRHYIREHILAMEKNIGRYLMPGEEVHHKDGNKLNNNINNLELFSSSSEHVKYEMRLRDFSKKLMFGNLPISNKDEILELFNNFQCS